MALNKYKHLEGLTHPTGLIFKDNIRGEILAEWVKTRSPWECLNISRDFEVLVFNPAAKMLR